MFATAGFRAWAGHARAAMLIAQSQHAEALPVLQAVVHKYRSLHARYDRRRSAGTRRTSMPRSAFPRAHGNAYAGTDQAQTPVAKEQQ